VFTVVKFVSNTCKENPPKNSGLKQFQSSCKLETGTEMCSNFIFGKSWDKRSFHQYCDPAVGKLTYYHANNEEGTPFIIGQSTNGVDM
jgi:hypothetical protein